MQKTKRNVKRIQNPKIEVDKSVPTYSDLNAFMRPSKISPRYTFKGDDSQKLENSDSSSDESKLSTSSPYDTDTDTDADVDTTPIEKIDEYDTAKNDTNIYNMKCILEKKKQLLLYKNREVKELAKQNAFLNNVLSDYEKIKLRILEEKRKQQDAIKIISKHISQLSKNMSKEDYHMKHLQDDQSVLLEELEKIKREMNEVMQS
jgi:hypothetical protein